MRNYPPELEVASFLPLLTWWVCCIAEFDIFVLCFFFLLPAEDMAPLVVDQPKLRWAKLLEQMASLKQFFVVMVCVLGYCHLYLYLSISIFLLFEWWDTFPPTTTSSHWLLFPSATVVVADLFNIWFLVHQWFLSFFRTIQIVVLWLHAEWWQCWYGAQLADLDPFSKLNLAQALQPKSLLVACVHVQEAQISMQVIRSQ